MHLSLDGYVADPNGAIDWITVSDEMFEYAGRQTRESDLAVYGRVTYELMEAYWPTAADQPNPSKHDIEHSAWYNSVEKLIVSKSMKGADIKNTAIISDNLATEFRKLKSGTGKNIVLFGSPGLTRELMDENLIDEYWLFINPILLGKGIPFFKKLKRGFRLKLLSSEAFPSGVVCLHYETETDNE